MDKGNKAKLQLNNLRIRHAVGNPASRRQLLCLHEVSDGTGGQPVGEKTGNRVVLGYFSSILILSESTVGDSEQDAEASDSRSLAATLAILDIQQASMLRMSALGKRLELFPPISEILDIRTAKQVPAAGAAGGRGVGGRVAPRGSSRREPAAASGLVTRPGPDSPGPANRPNTGRAQPARCGAAPA